MGFNLQDLGYIIGTIGAFLGGGWIINFYHAKPKRNSIEIDNMKKIVDELQDVMRQMSERNDMYKKQTDDEIDKLKKEIDELNIRVKDDNESIYSAYRCKLLNSIDECVVLKTFKSKVNCRDSKRVE